MSRLPPHHPPSEERASPQERASPASDLHLPHPSTTPPAQWGASPAGARLRFEPAAERPDLLAPPVAAALAAWDDAAASVPVAEIAVAEIDPDLADTAAFCERYGVRLDESANCVVVAARRGDHTRLAACMILATTRADVNGLVRKHLGARRASFAAVDVAVAETGMEYGGITPIGLPAGWPILVDAAVAKAPRVVVGSGVRRSKLWLPGAALAGLPGAEVLDGLGR